MLINTFYQLLDKHFAAPVDSSKLEGLEGDVLRRIKQIQLENSENWYEKIISVLFVPQFRFASLTVALAVGISASPILETAVHVEVNTLQLEAFSYELSPLSLHLRKN